MVKIKIDLPDSFFAEEERWGYVTPAAMKQVWAVELDLLCEFDRVCKKLGLRYFLDSGTLLGAVRDGRFIPWDDDIDVIMLREDYDRLTALGPAEFKEPMFLQNAYTDIDYRRGLSQLRRSDTTFILEREVEKRLPFNQGICIDIFVLDGLAPEGEVERHFAEKQAVRKQIGDLAKQPGHDPMAVRKLFRQYDGICKRYADAELLDTVMWKPDTQKLVYVKREWFSKSVELEFEGHLFPAPIGYHEVMAQYYGPDYMTPRTLPSDHGGVIWDVNVPYTQTLCAMYQASGDIN